MFELAFLSGVRAGEVVQVTRSLLAGRSPDCSLEVPDPNASRQHAKFEFTGTALTLVDNRSANGTYLNEQRVAAPCVLNHGDVVRMGETRIRIQVRAESVSGGVQGPGVASQNSSIFGFKDSDADLSASIVMSASEMPAKKVSLEQLQERFKAVMRAGKLLVHIDKSSEVLSGILDILFEIFPQADRGFLMLGQQADQLVPKAVKSRSKESTEGMAVSATICRHALEKKSALLFSDQNSNDFDQGMSIVSLKIRSAMTIPLIVNEEVLGLLQVDTPDRMRAFTPDDLDIAVAVSLQAAMALHNAIRMEKMQAEEKTKSNLCRFLPGPVAEQVMAGKLDLNLGGGTYQGTVLFSDVVGFTRMSESMAPEQVITLMNEYFERMVPCIQREGGSIDKFIGDAIMAFWGVPLDKGDSAFRGCVAALDMQIQLAGFNSILEASGRARIGHGIGLNTGPVVAGNIGTSNATIAYTLLGDSVNTASRIEHTACRGQVMVSLATWNELKGRACGIAMPPIAVRNKAEPLAILSLRGIRLDAGEVMISVPCRSGDAHVHLIRRLGDGTFVALHPKGMSLAAAPLMADCAEWHGIDLGVPQILSELPAQSADGELVRSQIRMPDADLHGLLADKPLPCALAWDQMVR